MWPFNLFCDSPSANAIITDTTNGISSGNSLVNQQQIAQIGQGLSNYTQNIAAQQQYLGIYQGYQQQAQQTAQNQMSQAGQILQYSGNSQPYWQFYNPQVPYISYEWAPKGKTIVWRKDHHDHGTKMFEIWKDV
jgi:hypothetical protein